MIYLAQVYAFKFQTFPMITDGTVSVHACCTYIHTYMYYYLSYESVFVVSYTCDFLMDRLNCKYVHTCTSYKSCHFFWHFNIFLCINNCSNLIRGCFLKINNDYLFKSEKKKQQKPHDNNTNNKKRSKKTTTI